MPVPLLREVDRPPATWEPGKGISEHRRNCSNATWLFAISWSISRSSLCLSSTSRLNCASRVSRNLSVSMVLGRDATGVEGDGGTVACDKGDGGATGMCLLLSLLWLKLIGVC